MWFILNENKEVVPSDSVSASSHMEDVSQRVVAYSDMPDGSLLSTVFLYLDHSMGISDGPILFESMWFGGPYNGHQRRYKTWKEAEEGHADMLEAYHEYQKYNADKLAKM
jgi:hypothetical protein